MTPISSEFVTFPKIPRLSKEIVITEKIDGTNAQVEIYESDSLGYWDDHAVAAVQYKGLWRVLRAGSRNRYLSVKNDNFGFAAFVRDNAEELVKLGPGRHFGEYWGRGIQHGYGLTERRFSLFNVGRWLDQHGTNDPAMDETQATAPACCYVVPIITRGIFASYLIEEAMDYLRSVGSRAANGWMEPEGIIVYHTAGNHLYKKLLKNDELPKGLAA